MAYPYQEMRRHERILVPHERWIRASANGTGPELEGRVTVIGLGGMFIRTNRVLAAGAVVHVKLTDPLLTLETDCIVRNVAENGLGVEFARLSAENECKLKDLLSHLKI